MWRNPDERVGAHVNSDSCKPACAALPVTHGDHSTAMTRPLEFSKETHDFCKLLPKVELHAHLNGSVRPETMKRLTQERGITLTKDQEDAMQCTNARTLSDCFKLFDVIHHVTTTHEAITSITREVVSDFAADGCLYLELRTTPKARPEHGMTKRSYVEAVLAGLDSHAGLLDSQPVKGIASNVCNGKTPLLSNGLVCSIMVKLLLSIDRREDADAAMDTVELAAHYPGRVVGIDLSGNPTVGTWSSWEPALQRARQLGLKVTVHAAEVYAPEETAAILDFRPDRLGHMCRLDEGLEAKLLASRIPVELCLTSNLKTCTVPTYADHHFAQLHGGGCPVVLCTDDSGVFGTSLSEEYAIAAKAFALDPVQLVQLVTASFDYLFCSAEEQQWLKSRACQMLSMLGH